MLIGTDSPRLIVSAFINQTAIIYKPLPISWTAIIWRQVASCKWLPRGRGCCSVKPLGDHFATITICHHLLVKKFCAITVQPEIFPSYKEVTAFFSLKCAYIYYLAASPESIYPVFRCTATPLSWTASGDDNYSLSFEIPYLLLGMNWFSCCFKDEDKGGAFRCFHSHALCHAVTVYVCNGT